MARQKITFKHEQGIDMLGQYANVFSIAMIVGILVGTYSSIYVASSIALSLGISKEDLMPTVIEKEGEDQDQLMP